MRKVGKGNKRRHITQQRDVSQYGNNYILITPQDLQQTVFDEELWYCCGLTANATSAVQRALTKKGRCHLGTICTFLCVKNNTIMARFSTCIMIQFNNKNRKSWEAGTQLGI